MVVTERDCIKRTKRIRKYAIMYGWSFVSHGNYTCKCGANIKVHVIDRYCTHRIYLICDKCRDKCLSSDIYGTKWHREKIDQLLLIILGLWEYDPPDLRFTIAYGRAFAYLKRIPTNLKTRK